MTIRRITPQNDIAALTGLLHGAYTRWCYLILERVQRNDVNYPSVIMRRPLSRAKPPTTTIS